MHGLPYRGLPHPPAKLRLLLSFAKSPGNCQVQKIPSGPSRLNFWSESTQDDLSETKLFFLVSIGQCIGRLQSGVLSPLIFEKPSYSFKVATIFAQLRLGSPTNVHTISLFVLLEKSVGFPLFFSPLGQQKAS